MLRISVPRRAEVDGLRPRLQKDVSRSAWSVAATQTMLSTALLPSASGSNTQGKWGFTSLLTPLFPAEMTKRVSGLAAIASRISSSPAFLTSSPSDMFATRAPWAPA